MTRTLGFLGKPKSFSHGQDPKPLSHARGHDLLEPGGSRHAYHLTTKGVQAALLFLFFHKLLCGSSPTTASTINPTPNTDPKAASR
jgi:hypothetical protein